MWSVSGCGLTLFVVAVTCVISWIFGCFADEMLKHSWILKSCVASVGSRVYFLFNLIPGGFKKVWEHLKCGSLIPAVITFCIFIHFLLGSLWEGWVSALQPGEALNEWPLRQSEVPRLQQTLNGEQWPLGPDAGGCSGCLWITLIPWNNGAPLRSLLRGELINNNTWINAGESGFNAALWASEASAVKSFVIKEFPPLLSLKASRWIWVTLLLTQSAGLHCEISLRHTYITTDSCPCRTTGVQDKGRKIHPKV